MNENKKYLLVCVGRLSPEKGVDELIKTLPMLKDCALWLVGDGPFRPVSVFVSVHCVDAVVQLELTLLCLILYHRSWKGLLVT